MVYRNPRVEIEQLRQRVPQSFPREQSACIVGPHAHLVRFSESDERANGLLGYYDDVVQNCYAWPNLPLGAKVDLDYTRIHITDALLQYFEDLVDAGSTITKTNGYSNRIRSATLSFAANGEDYPASAAFLDRGVKVGDTAKVVSGDHTLWTYVRGFAGDAVSAVVDEATAAASNAVDQSADSSIEQTAGAENCITAVQDATEYDGLPSGNINETYRVIVTKSSTGSDHTTGKIRVISGSGNDDVVSVTPSEAGEPTAIGTRGLFVTFDIDVGSCSLSAEDEDVPSGDLIAGQEWLITVEQEYSEPDATSGGTYTGDVDQTYIVEVTRGGEFGAETPPQISVTTDRGLDISGPHNVSDNVAVAIGAYGVTITLTGDGLRKGDKWTIPAQAEAEGAYRTLILGHSLSDEISGGDQVSLTLYIRKPELEITKNRVGFAPQLNWEPDAETICINEGILAYDDEWTDEGVPQALDVYSEPDKGWGRVYVTYRAWRQDLVGVLNSVADVGDLDDAIPGELDNDNLLKMGVFHALTTANGRTVYFNAVSDPDDDDSWLEAMEVLVGREELYIVTPLTYDGTVLTAYQGHVGSQSGAEQGYNREMFCGLERVPSKVIVDASSTTDNDEALATIADNPNVSGTQYTLWTIPAGNAQLDVNDVRVGDVVRALYSGDGFGGTTYTEFVIEEVLNEDQFLTSVGHSVEIDTPQKIEIWRNLTPAEEAEEIGANAGAFGDFRVTAVFADNAENDGTSKENYYVACALAGLASGVEPNRSLTNASVAGFTDIRRTRFNKTHLDTMAGAGVCLVVQARDGEIFCRHGVTTGDTEDVNEREEMVTRNVDSVSFRFRDAMTPFIGTTNVTPSVIKRIELELASVIEELKKETDPDLGGQLIDAQIIEVRQHLTLKDTIVVTIDLEIPYATNVIRVQLVI